jgi:hypothetical protein
VFAEGGDVKLDSLAIRPMRSIWRTQQAG